MGLKQVHFIVRGRVQGVFFRASTQREAKRLASLVFFLDHQIGRYVVAAALRAAGAGAELPRPYQY